jgi:hypothetical protein
MDRTQELRSEKQRRASCYASQPPSSAIPPAHAHRLLRRLPRAIGTMSLVITAITAARPITAASVLPKPAAARARSACLGFKLRNTGLSLRWLTRATAVMLRHRVSPSASPMTGSGGAPSTPRPPGSICSVFGILDHPPSRMMTVGGAAHSCAIDHLPDSNFKQPTQLRDPAARFRPSFARNVLPSYAEGAGNAGRPTRPQPGGQKKTATPAVVTTVTPETPGIPRAMVLRFPSCSPR